jgi:hypothetical protein
MVMKVFTCNDHEGFYPVGTASVVVATDRDHAYRLLQQELLNMGFAAAKAAVFTLEELPTDEPFVRVLCDGNY